MLRRTAGTRPKTRPPSLGRPWRPLLLLLCVAWTAPAAASQVTQDEALEALLPKFHADLRAAARSPDGDAFLLAAFSAPAGESEAQRAEGLLGLRGVLLKELAGGVPRYECRGGTCVIEVTRGDTAVSFWFRPAPPGSPAAFTAQNPRGDVGLFAEQVTFSAHVGGPGTLRVLFNGERTFAVDDVRDSTAVSTHINSALRPGPNTVTLVPLELEEGGALYVDLRVGSFPLDHPGTIDSSASNLLAWTGPLDAAQTFEFEVRGAGASVGADPAGVDGRTTAPEDPAKGDARKGAPAERPGGDAETKATTHSGDRDAPRSGSARSVDGDPGMKTSAEPGDFDAQARVPMDPEDLDGRMEAGADAWLAGADPEKAFAPWQVDASRADLAAVQAAGVKRFVLMGFELDLVVADIYLRSGGFLTASGPQLHFLKMRRDGEIYVTTHPIDGLSGDLQPFAGHARTLLAALRSPDCAVPMADVSHIESLTDFEPLLEEVREASAHAKEVAPKVCAALTAETGPAALRIDDVALMGLDAEGRGVGVLRIELEVLSPTEIGVGIGRFRLLE